MTVSPQVAAAAASTRTEAQVRAATLLVRAQNAYRAAYRESLQDGVTIERRAELELLMDDATEAMSAARKAMNAAKSEAQQVAA